MPASAKILIVSASNADLTAILSGYLHFYSQQQSRIAFKGKPEVIHPLAQQVLTEDGIDQWPMSSYDPLQTYDMTIFLNQPTDASLAGKSHTQQINLRDPMQNTAYEIMLSDLRLAREQLKRHAIELIGSLQVVS